ncbi:MAG: type II toxin-antitoxin system PemK/MazF family toxin [Geminicoccaceae bacterium]
MDLATPPARFEAWLVNRAPTVGAQIRKTRPAVVVSPDEMDRHLWTAMVALMATATLRSWPSRDAVLFQGRTGDVALHQLRAVDRARLVRRIGAIGDDKVDAVVAVLAAVFARLTTRAGFVSPPCASPAAPPSTPRPSGRPAPGSAGR